MPHVRRASTRARTPPRAPRWSRPGRRATADRAAPWDRGALDAIVLVPGRPRTSGRGRHAAASTPPALETRRRRRGRTAWRPTGVRRGDVVSWQLPNGAPAFLLYRACWRLGAVAAPLHHRLGGAEVRGALDQVRPVAGRGRRRHARRAVARGRSSPPEGGSTHLLDALGPGPALGARDQPGAARPTSPSPCSRRGRPGCPRRPCTPTGAWATRPPSWWTCTGSGAGDAVLMPAPLAHVSGLLNGVLLPGDGRHPDRAHGGLGPRRGPAPHRGGAGVVHGRAARLLLPDGGDRPASRRERVRSLRLVSTGGASVSPAFVDATSESFGCRVKRTYGSTEAPTVTTSGPDDSVERARDTDGRALGEVELEVHDPETSAPPRAGRAGRDRGCGGPSCSPATPIRDATARVLSDRGRWFRTGDLGVLDERGLAPGGGPALATSSSGPGRTSRPRRSKPSSRPTPTSATPWPWPCPTPTWASAWPPSSRPPPPSTWTACRAWFSARGVTRFKTPEMVVQLDALPVLAAGKPDRHAHHAHRWRAKLRGDGPDEHGSCRRRKATALVRTL